MSRTVLVGILGVSLLVLTACESMTGKSTGQTIDDATVTASIQGKLTADKLENFSRINVDTDRSVVTLNGVVRTVEEKSRAEDLARLVAGVRIVNNNLQIQSLADTVNAPTETQDGDKQTSEEVGGGQSPQVHAIKGEVLRVVDKATSSPSSSTHSRRSATPSSSKEKIRHHDCLVHQD